MTTKLKRPADQDEVSASLGRPFQPAQRQGEAVELLAEQGGARGGREQRAGHNRRDAVMRAVFVKESGDS